ncbi:MAG: hypothetical protein WCX97_00155 [Candidatus Magasanikbacteria bacterium]
MLNREEIKKIIDGNDFTGLLGQLENEYFDAKSQIYNLNDDRVKQELAKDVASFANLDGGYIIIGLRTAPSKLYDGDEVVELVPIDKNLINTSQYEGIIKDWIYPGIKGFSAKWLPHTTDASKGYLIIDVPPQDSSTKPFLINRFVGTKKNSTIIFGYAERRSDKSESKKIEDIQSIMRLGLNFESNIKERFDSIEAMLNQQTKQKESSVGRPDYKVELLSEDASALPDLTRAVELEVQLAARIAETLHANNLGDNRYFVLAAYPSGQSELKTVFSSSPDSIKSRLENPPVIRNMGWSLETLDQAHIIRGEYIRVTNGTRKTIDLYRDGTLIFACSADDKFLARGEIDNALALVSLAVIEAVYNFVSFYKVVLADFEINPTEVRFGVRLGNMHLGNVKNGLIPHDVKTYGYMFGDDFTFAPSDNWMKLLPSFKVDELDVGKVAFKIVREIYLWFGFDDSMIPYAKVDEEHKIIDPLLISGSK